MDRQRKGSARKFAISTSVIRPAYRFRGFFLAGALLAFSVAPSRADNYALLIGAADYQNPNINKLKGPPNDVTLMWRLLTEKRGFNAANITVLADGLKDKAGLRCVRNGKPDQPCFPSVNGEPKRAAIMKAFADLADKAKSGDLVLIFYSGHGTEQPVKNADQNPERDNLDQVMLPTDTGDYDRATKTVQNGIVDDDIGAALDKIRDKNADVWVIIDACHAGSMTRGLVDGTAVRGVDPSRLGIPPAPPAPVTAKATAPEAWALPSKSARGSLVGFFAVDSSREAIERAFEEFDSPMVGEGSEKRAGVFTYFLWRALSDSKHNASRYQDLASLIVTEMRNSENPPSARPAFDGDLNRPVLAGGAVPTNPVWKVEIDGDHVAVPAGTLHGLAANTVLKLSASPDGPKWGTATVTKVAAIHSTADLDKPVPGGERPAELWASVLVPSVSFQLTVAEPPASELSDPAAAQFVEKLKAAARDGAIEWVAAQAPAQLRLRVYNGKVWLLGTDGEWIRKDLQEKDSRLRAYPENYSVSIEPERAEKSVSELAATLSKKARAANLVRVAQNWSETQANDGAAKDIVITAERYVQRGNNDPYRECPKQFSPDVYEKVSSFEDKTVPSLQHCDAIRVKVENVSARDFDINVSYIDAAGTIVSLTDPCVVTLPARSPAWTFPAKVSNWRGGKTGAPDTVGREHIVVTALEQKDGIQSSDLCFNQVVTRGIKANNPPVPGAARSFLNTLKDAALAPAATRGIVIQKEPDETQEASATVFSFEIMPARLP